MNVIDGAELGEPPGAGPLTVAALGAVAAVWLAGCAWSFEEQTRFANRHGFALPWLLPVVIDGLAVAMAAVATAASLDGRAAISARFTTAVAVTASAVSNATAAVERTTGDSAAIVIAAGVPVAANLAFEVLLSEVRCQVRRRRGQPPPVALPWPRAIRLVLLAPIRTVVEWRTLVLAMTHLPAPATSQLDGALEQAQRQVPAVLAKRNGAASPEVDTRVCELVDLLAGGHELTGNDVAARFAVSARTGRRLLRTAQQLHSHQ